MENFQPASTRQEAMQARLEKDFSPKGIKKRLDDLPIAVREVLDVELNMVGLKLELEQEEMEKFLANYDGQKIAGYLGSILLEWKTRQNIDRETMKEMAEYMEDPGAQYRVVH
jgi:hypothetical protein